MGIQDSALSKSLGMFLLVLLCLMVLLLVYFALKATRIQNSIAHKIKMKLEQKLFFRSFLRYMIASNLELNFTAWAFILSQWGFNSLQQGAMSVFQLLLIFILFLWPAFIVLLMMKYQNRLEDPFFVQRWETIYQGIKIEHRAALVYYAVFCLRRT